VISPGKKPQILQTSQYQPLQTSMKTGATEFPNSVPPRFQKLAVGLADTKLVPPVSKTGATGFEHRVKPKDVYVWFLCLSQLTWVT
jgi:hypothetical protein